MPKTPANNAFAEKQAEVQAKEPQPVYSPEQSAYFGYLLRRLIHSRDERDLPSEKWDGKTFLWHLDDNERAFNATIQPRKNSADWRSKGRKQTTHKKIMAIAGGVMEQNLQPTIKAFDKEDSPIDDLGEGLTAAIRRTQEIERDEEKCFNMIIELLKNGTVFVEDVFEVVDREIKELNPINWALGETLDSATWTKRVVKDKRDAEKNILRLNQVYLGDIRQIEMEKQPFVFTRKVLTYDDARAKYGNYAMFKHVKPGGYRSSTFDDISYLPDFRLAALQADEVEEIRYQSAPDDEYQIILNGVMMLPIGFPLPWKHKRYNIVKRILYPISAHFAYGHGLVHKLKYEREVLDVLVNLAVDKGRQSLAPPMATMSKQILDSTVFMPNKVNYNMPPDQLKPIIPALGPTSSEFNLIQYMEQSIDETSVSKTATGSPEQKDTTATQAVLQQQQATKMLGMILFAYGWLVRDLGWLRAMNILENYSQSLGESVDDKTNQIVQKYRVLTQTDSPLEDGTGLTIIHFAPRDQHPTPAAIFQAEAKKKKAGVLTKEIYIDGDFVRALDTKVHVIVESEQKESSDQLQKVLFQDFVEGAMTYFPQVADASYLAKRYAEVWGEQAEKVFPNKAGAGGPPPTMGPQPPQPPQGPQQGAPPIGGPQAAAQMKRGAKLPQAAPMDPMAQQASPNLSNLLKQ